MLSTQYKTQAVRAGDLIEVDLVDGVRLVLSDFLNDRYMMYVLRLDSVRKTWFTDIIMCRILARAEDMR